MNTGNGARSAPAASAVLELGDRLCAEGSFLEAVEALTAANRRHRAPEIERRLVEIRCEAARAGCGRAEPSRSAPDRPADPFPDVVGSPPEVRPDELSADVLAGAVAHHGSLIVREMFPRPRVDRLLLDIARAFDAHRDRYAGTPDPQTAPWYEPFVPRQPEPGLMELNRVWAKGEEAIYAADSPPTFFDLMEGFEELGVRTLLEALFGERPQLLVQKCAIRRLRGKDQVRSAWHQDGRFLPMGIRAMNAWLSLSDCGLDAPGLDLVPRRVGELVETGTDNAMYDWCVGGELVERARGDVPIARPVFAPGDVLFFDELLLHRTGSSAAMANERYGVETWFIAASTYRRREGAAPAEDTAVDAWRHDLWVPLVF